MFGLISTKKHLEIMNKFCEWHNKEMSVAIMDAYNEGVKYGKSTIVNKLTPNEIREALGLPRVSSEEVSDNDKKGK